MSNTENANTGTAWKKKYFDSLKEIEDSEQKWEKIEDLLRLGISRLTLLAESTDNKKLDDQIVLLRKSIRDGTESNRLVSLIETISEEIKKLPDAPEGKFDKVQEKTRVIHNQTDVLILLETIIDTIIVNRHQEIPVEKFKKTLSNSGSDKSENLIQVFSDLISSLIEAETPATPEITIKEEKESFVERRKDNRAVDDFDNDIDRTIDAKKNSLVAPAVGELILQLMTRFPPSFTKLLNEKDLARAASAARNRKDLLHIIDSISQELSQFIRKTSSENNGNGSNSNESDGEILIHLLQRISLPDYLSEQAQKLKKEIEKGISENNVTQMVEETADLIMQMRVQLQSEKQELEQFLTEISNHLTALDIDIQITSRLRDESVDNLNQYEDDLESEVCGLESGIDKTEELEGLKSLVKERVKTIRVHMGGFRKSEEQRSKTAEIAIKKLKTRIIDMEQETQKLREQVKIEHNSAVRDALTKIPNRLAYEERIESELERCKRYKTTIAFVVWDIDHFKGINDHYGHIAGDKVLSVIAEVLRKNLRAADFIARYGGEEFVVIMPETEIDEAEKGCEKIRYAIENCNFHYRDTSVPITASCGYTTYVNGDSKENLFDRADKALYKAKENGRNQCVKG